MPLELAPDDPDFQRDPYPVYHRLRREDPLHLRVYGETGATRIWWLTRYEDIAFVLRDPRFSAEKIPPEFEALRSAPQETPFQPLLRVFLDNLLVRDPPDHTRLRNLVNKAFTPRVVERLRPRIRDVLGALLTPRLGSERLDLIADVAAPLPLIVIAELLGVPVADRDKLEAWSDGMIPLIDSSIREAHIVEVVKTAAELRDYFEWILARRRRDPQPDLMSRLIAAQEQEDALSESEVIATCILILTAGHETTTHLIGNGMLALLRHRSELARLRDDPALVPNAVEELLRYDGPVQVTARIPREDVEVGGRVIPKGQEVDVILGAANRDPAVFPEPDRLDVGRRSIRHLAFGHGIHFCLGAPLARAEAQIAIDTLLRRLPDLALDADELRWRPGLVLRGLVALPLRFGPAA